MDLAELNEILKCVRYPHFEIFVSGEEGRFYMQARHPGGPPEGLQHTRKWYISKHACKNEVVQTALKLVLTAVEHEAREYFTYKGKKIFGPHYDVDVLVEICGKDANLDYRRLWAGECPGCAGRGKHAVTCIDYFDEKTHGYPNRPGMYD